MPDDNKQIGPAGATPTSAPPENPTGPTGVAGPTESPALAWQGALSFPQKLDGLRNAVEENFNRYYQAGSHNMWVQGPDEKRNLSHYMYVTPVGGQDMSEIQQDPNLLERMVGRQPGVLPSFNAVAGLPVQRVQTNVPLKQERWSSMFDPIADPVSMYLPVYEGQTNEDALSEAVANNFGMGGTSLGERGAAAAMGLIEALPFGELLYNYNPSSGLMPGGNKFQEQKALLQDKMAANERESAFTPGHVASWVAGAKVWGLGARAVEGVTGKALAGVMSRMSKSGLAERIASRLAPDVAWSPTKWLRTVLSERAVSKLTPGTATQFERTIAQLEQLGVRVSTEGGKATITLPANVSDDILKPIIANFNHAASRAKAELGAEAQQLTFRLLRSAPGSIATNVAGVTALSVGSDLATSFADPNQTAEGRLSLIRSIPEIVATQTAQDLAMRGLGAIGSLVRVPSGGPIPGRGRTWGGGDRVEPMKRLGAPVDSPGASQLNTFVIPPKIVGKEPQTQAVTESLAKTMQNTTNRATWRHVNQTVQGLSAQQEALMQQLTMATKAAQANPGDPGATQAVAALSQQLDLQGEAILARLSALTDLSHANLPAATRVAGIDVYSHLFSPAVDSAAPNTEGPMWEIIRWAEAVGREATAKGVADEALKDLPPVMAAGDVMSLQERVLQAADNVARLAPDAQVAPPAHIRMTRPMPKSLVDAGVAQLAPKPDLGIDRKRLTVEDAPTTEDWRINPQNAMARTQLILDRAASSHPSAPLGVIRFSKPENVSPLEDEAYGVYLENGRVRVMRPSPDGQGLIPVDITNGVDAAQFPLEGVPVVEVSNLSPVNWTIDEQGKFLITPTDTAALRKNRDILRAQVEDFRGTTGAEGAALRAADLINYVATASPSTTPDTWRGIIQESKTIEDALKQPSVDDAARYVPKELAYDEAGPTRTTLDRFGEMTAEYFGQKQMLEAVRLVARGALTRWGHITQGSGLAHSDFNDNPLVLSENSSNYGYTDNAEHMLQSPYYSQVVRNVETNPQGKWDLKTLENYLRKQKGISPVEVDAMGLANAFAGKNKLTKEELLDWMYENSMQVEFHTMTDKDYALPGWTSGQFPEGRRDHSGWVRKGNRYFTTTIFPTLSRYNPNEPVEWTGWANSKPVDYMLQKHEGLGGWQVLRKRTYQDRQEIEWEDVGILTETPEEARKAFQKMIAPVQARYRQYIQGLKGGTMYEEGLLRTAPSHTVNMQAEITKTEVQLRAYENRRDALRALILAKPVSVSGQGVIEAPAREPVDPALLADVINTYRSVEDPQFMPREASPAEALSILDALVSQTTPGMASGKEQILYEPVYKYLTENHPIIREYLETTAEVITAREKLHKLELTDNSQGYKGGHFGVNNVASHFRMDRRSTRKDEVDFIHEVQSDWTRELRDAHQNRLDRLARRHRLSPTDPDLEARLQVLASPWEKEIIDAKGEQLAPIDEVPADWHQVDLFDDRGRPEILTDINDMRAMGIPSSPLSGVNRWLPLTLKTALRRAAERGATRLAWSNSEIQKVRYNLGGYVENIQGFYDPDQDLWDIEVRLRRRGDEDSDIDPEDWVPDYARKQISTRALEKEIGKELVGYLRKYAGEGGAFDADSTRLEGEEWPVPWAESLYDTQIPAAINKLIKKHKWDTQVETITLTNDVPDFESTLAELEENLEVVPRTILPQTEEIDPETHVGDWAIVDSRTQETLEELSGNMPYDDAQSALVDWIGENANLVHQHKLEELNDYQEDDAPYSQTVNSIKITDKMRRDLLEGVALFDRKHPYALREGETMPAGIEEQVDAIGWAMPKQGGVVANARPTIRHDGVLSLRGQIVRNHQQLAAISQALRNPHFEILHYVYVGKDTGRVYGHMALSGRMPGSTSAFEFSSSTNALVQKELAGGGVSTKLDKAVRADMKRNLAQMMARMDRIQKGTGEPVQVMMVHNHPSGHVNPSEADLYLTRLIGTSLSEAGYSYGGHIVINHNKYTSMQLGENGTVDVTEGHTLPMPAGTPDPNRQASVDHWSLKEKVGGPRTLSRLGALINQNPNAFTTLIGIDTTGLVVGVELMPNGMWRNPKLRQWLRSRARAFGAREMFMHHPEPTPEMSNKAIGLMADHTIVDFADNRTSAIQSSLSARMTAAMGERPASQRSIMATTRLREPNSEYAGEPGRIEALEMARQGGQFSKRPDLFKKLTEEEKFMAVKNRLATGYIQSETHLQRLDPARWESLATSEVAHPPRYFGRWRPTPSQHAELKEIFKRRQAEFKRELATLDAMRKNERLTLDDIMAVQLPTLDRIMSQDPSLFHRFVQNLNRDYEHLIETAKSKGDAAEELRQVFLMQKVIEGAMGGEGTPPPGPREGGSQLQASTAEAAAALHKISRPVMVVGFGKQILHPKEMKAAIDNGLLSTDVYSVLDRAHRDMNDMNNADMREFEDLLRAINRNRNWNKGAGKWEGIGDDISKKLWFALDQGVESPAILSNYQWDVSIAPLRNAKINLAEVVPKMRAFLNKKIEQASKVESLSLAIRRAEALEEAAPLQRALDQQILELAREKYGIDARSVDGIEAAYKEQVPFENREIGFSVEWLRQQLRKTPLGGDFEKFSRIEGTMKKLQEKAAEYAAEMEELKAGKLYRKNYIYHIHQKTAPDIRELLEQEADVAMVEIMKRDPEIAVDFLKQRDANKEPITDFFHGFELYVRALNRKIALEPALHKVEQLTSKPEYPVAQRQYTRDLVDRIKGKKHPADQNRDKAMRLDYMWDQRQEGISADERMNRMGQLSGSLRRNLGGLLYGAGLNPLKISLLNLLESRIVAVELGHRLADVAKAPLWMASGYATAAAAGVRSKASGLKSALFGTPKWMSQAHRAHVLDYLHEHSTLAQQLTGVGERQAGWWGRMQNKATQWSFSLFGTTATEKFNRAGAFYTFRNQGLSHGLSEEDANWYASVRTRLVIPSYGVMDQAPAAQSELGKWALMYQRFGMGQMGQLGSHIATAGRALTDNRFGQRSRVVAPPRGGMGQLVTQKGPGGSTVLEEEAGNDPTMAEAMKIVRARPSATGVRFPVDRVAKSRAAQWLIAQFLSMGIAYPLYDVMLDILGINQSPVSVMAPVQEFTPAPAALQTANDIATLTRYAANPNPTPYEQREAKKAVARLKRVRTGVFLTGAGVKAIDSLLRVVE